jgi:hypothetical protein
LIIAISLLLSACDFSDFSFGTKRVTDPAEYGKWESYLEIPDFLPSTVEDLKVNSYSYIIYAYMDICYEIFLDITVTKEQFDSLISKAKNEAEYLYEKEAYYCDGYYEIVFEDYYDVFVASDINHKTQPVVGYADIEKIIYNEASLNIIYVCLHANDTGVYDLDDVAYFNRFYIKEKEYEKNIDN